jgi:hypothetical protein
MLRPIVIATLIAGTLDIISAFVFAGMAGMSVLGVLKFVASGPFGDAPTETLGWGLVGLAVHFAIMTCMVTAYMLVAPRFAILLRQPIVAGILYGILLWIIMYWIVRPLRFPELPLPHTLKGIGQALFSHCILVGIPIALVASRFFGRRVAEPATA